MKKKAFTLIELIAVLVILAILALIVTPLVMNIITKSRILAGKRSVDAYGRSIEIAIANYLLEKGAFPTDLSELTVEYSGKNLVCNVIQLKENGAVYLSECTFNGVEIKDNSNEDGWYHYGTAALTNEDYVELYGHAIESALSDYYQINNNYPNNISDLTIKYSGKNVICSTTINKDGTVYLTQCKVDNIDVKDDSASDGWYHYGNKFTAINELLSKANDKNITTYSAGNGQELYQFNQDATDQTKKLTEYRYIGDSPNNYIMFNGEKWRIIGIFETEDNDENTSLRLKIVNSNYRNSQAYGSSNNWINSTVKEYLNDTYYNSLSEQSKLMVKDAKYYLGGISSTSISGEAFYKAERSNNVYGSNEKSWIGKIGLIYPSDYSYVYSMGVNDGCYSKSACDGYYDYAYSSWLLNDSSISLWTMTPYISSGDRSYYVEYYYRIQTGALFVTIADEPVSSSNYILPTLYLDENVIITEGDGTNDNPYQLSL